MSYEIPPVEGCFYKGRSGGLRRVVSVLNVRKTFGKWVYEVEWAPAKNIHDVSGRPRKNMAWCTTWENWVHDRVTK